MTKFVVCADNNNGDVEICPASCIVDALVIAYAMTKGQGPHIIAMDEWDPNAARGAREGTEVVPTPYLVDRGVPPDVYRMEQMLAEHDNCCADCISKDDLAAEIAAAGGRFNVGNMANAVDFDGEDIDELLASLKEEGLGDIAEALAALRNVMTADGITFGPTPDESTDDVVARFRARMAKLNEGDA